MSALREPDTGGFLQAPVRRRPRSLHLPPPAWAPACRFPLAERPGLHPSRCTGPRASWGAPRLGLSAPTCSPLGDGSGRCGADSPSRRARACTPSQPAQPVLAVLSVVAAVSNRTHSGQEAWRGGVHRAAGGGTCSCRKRWRLPGRDGMSSSRSSRGGGVHARGRTREGWARRGSGALAGMNGCGRSQGGVWRRSMGGRRGSARQEEEQQRWGEARKEGSARGTVERALVLVELQTRWKRRAVPVHVMRLAAGRACRQAVVAGRAAQQQQQQGARPSLPVARQQGTLHSSAAGLLAQ